MSDNISESGGKRRVLLGQIVSVHGIRGDVIVRSFTQVPEDIAAYGALSDATGTRFYKLRVVRASDKGVVARIDGINDRTAAEALRGCELYIDRARLPATEEAEFYHADLIGLTAELADGTTYGKVAAVQNFGAGDLLEIELVGGGSEFVSFSDATVPSVDLERGVVIIAPAAFAADDEDDEQDGEDEDGEQSNGSSG